MRRQTIGWWVMVAVLALSTPALAHVSTEFAVEPTAVSIETLAAASPAPEGLGMLLAAIAVGLTLIARRRRAVAVACMVLLLVVAFEAGVHSVHHLADQPDSRCVIASASAHTGGVAVDTVAFERPVDAILLVVVTLSASPTSRPAAPDLGRAPPTA